MANPIKILKNGIINENPTFVQVIGMCPTLAVTSSAINGIGMGLGFTIALGVLGLVREFIGAGTLFDITVLPEAFPRTLLFVMAPGAFFTLACLMAALNYFRNKKKA